MTPARRAAPRDVIAGKGRNLANEEVFFDAAGGSSGKAFGDDQTVRLSYATSIEQIEEGARRLAKFCK